MCWLGLGILRKADMPPERLKSSWGKEPRQTDDFHIITSMCVHYTESGVALGNGYSAQGNYTCCEVQIS